MLAMRRILIVTPNFPWPQTGADQQDRGEGLRQLLRLGHELEVITKIDSGKETIVDQVAKELNIKIRSVTYKRSKSLQRLIKPAYWDGAAYEYADQEIVQALESSLESFKPDLVWFEYTYLWPLYKYVTDRKIPIITRSINFEPTHFLDETGNNIVNRLRVLPKYKSERETVSGSDLIFAITPNEADIYAKMGAKNVVVLPLRALGRILSEPAVGVKDKSKLDIYFSSGSTYNVEHNLAALKFVLVELAPVLNKNMQERFVLHITGKHMSNDFVRRCTGNIVYHGFVEDYSKFMADMDIAIAPSLFGAGMQQKVFEPIVRGLPTVAHKRAISGYDLESGKHYLSGTTAQDFAKALMQLADINLRRSISEAGRNKSQELFNQNKLDSIVVSSINEVLS